MKATRVVLALLGGSCLVVGCNTRIGDPEESQSQYVEVMEIAKRTAIASTPRPEWFRVAGVSLTELHPGTLLVGVEVTEIYGRWDEKEQKLMKNPARASSESFVVNVLCREFLRMEPLYDAEGKEKASKGSKYWRAEVVSLDGTGLSGFRPTTP